MEARNTEWELRIFFISKGMFMGQKHGLLAEEEGGGGECGGDNAPLTGSFKEGEDCSRVRTGYDDVEGEEWLKMRFWRSP